MKSEDFAEWAKHYDILFWTFTAIMIVAISGLFAYSLDKFNYFLSVFGLIITGISVYFAASFRELRHFMTKNSGSALMKEYDRRLLKHQWLFYIFFFICIETLWIALLVVKSINRSFNDIAPLKIDCCIFNCTSLPLSIAIFLAFITITSTILLGYLVRAKKNH